jgi:hypothetical protein
LFQKARLLREELRSRLIASRVIAEFASEDEARECVMRLRRSGFVAVVDLRVLDPGLPGIVSLARPLWSVAVDSTDAAMASALLHRQGLTR